MMKQCSYVHQIVESCTFFVVMKEKWEQSGSILLSNLSLSFHTVPDLSSNGRETKGKMKCWLLTPRRSQCCNMEMGSPRLF